MHYSKEIWGADAHVFRPDRWLEENNAARERYWMPVSEASSSRYTNGSVCMLTQLRSLEQGTAAVQGRTSQRLNLSRLRRPWSGITISNRWTRRKIGSGRLTLRWFRILGLSMWRRRHEIEGVDVKTFSSVHISTCVELSLNSKSHTK
jgi:hypothetical protein